MKKNKAAKPKVKRARSTDSTKFYVNNAALLPVVIEDKANNKISDKLIRMIQMIAERYSRKSNFVGYTFREDMVSAAVMNLCNNALKFNPAKSSNPFSYYTTGIHHSFLQYMADEKRHRNIRDSLLVDAGANPSFNYQDDKHDHDAEIKESDDIPITQATSDDLINPVETPLHNPDVNSVFKPRNPSFTRQVFNALDPGKPGNIARSKFADLNPGPVTHYKPEDVEIDPVTGRCIIKNPKPFPKPLYETDAKTPVKKKVVKKKTVKAKKKKK